MLTPQLPPTFSGWLSAEQTTVLSRRLSFSLDELMLEMLPVAANFALTPISDFKVGAVCRGSSGNLYCGANFEFLHLPISTTIHAEQAAIANAYVHQESGIDSMAVTAAPCGHCRQFLLEVNTASDIKILMPDKSPIQLTSLLPEAFGPGDLNIDSRLFTPKAHEMKLDTDDDTPIVRAALLAAQRSYAPYSGNFSGVAIETADGEIYQGSVMESVAYNPTLPPLQSALVAFILAGKKLQEISRAVLVETKQAGISYESTTRATLNAISDADFSVYLGEVG